ncbi:energy transducer TonB [Aequorivita capsosiphonis]|uniref:energy transducer TonB n=1 Tax=Aequorivita capsosiphonis TaxID=487317 RepID=UPI00040567FF|nr:energy transducer TonB [Aequorivita capsosiphonis]
MKIITENASNKRDEKKQINIKWNSRLFFQFGVVLSLLTVFFVMQLDFEKRVAEITPPSSEGIKEPPMIDYVIDLDRPKPITPKKEIIQKREPRKRVVKSSTFDVKPDTTPDIETPIASGEDPIAKSPKVTVDNPVDTKPSLPKSISNVEFVPIFPGCGNLTSNAEKVQCMSTSIDAFINKNFNRELLENLNAGQTYRVYVNFKIDSNGFVTNVIANSHEAALTKEAQRVISKLPTMKPGKQGDKNVDVLYTVPIVLRIQ